MSNGYDFIQRIIDSEKPESSVHEQALLRESVQKMCLSSLQDSGFFRYGAFHGGTALRIFFGNPRFSEDLDFSLNKMNKNFSWDKHTSNLKAEFSRYGFDIELKDRRDVKNVRSIFIKEQSLGKLLSLSFPPRPGKKISVKLEVDINPPAGATTEIRYIDFPIRKPIVVYDHKTSFSGKLHALLCREYVKGRDWYDFTWYVGKKVVPNMRFFRNALNQQGPWAHKRLRVDHDWIIDTLYKKIGDIDWNVAKRELSSFLVGNELVNLTNWWGNAYFNQKIEEFLRYLKTAKAG
jgi:predicted nucleotidyltransferase component of viral defense system